MSDELETMVEAARLAGASLAANFGHVADLAVTEKGPGDFVSAADIASQRIIAAHLASKHPDIPMLGEEDRGPAIGVAGRRFVVDPLDGTTNFLHGIPHFAVSIALEQDGEVLAGVVLDPCRQELFLAVKGGGCFLQRADGARTPLTTSRRATLADAVVATGIPHRARGDHPTYLRGLAAVMDEVSGIRRFGAAALDLAYVAAGRFDAFFESGLARWDVSAGILLVREAGGHVTELVTTPSSTPGTVATPASTPGTPDPVASGNVLATNGRLFTVLESLLRGAVDR